ncbi:hypothetical protein AVEN_225272-1 [Araneus ventricosus]|uniref:Uncharacterized protein n=1 Tax=Araneus ventricosus TaxID=182803 RepID=A0A4Y2AMW7_ARAVE|nr:hypothetical protein AVEN_225272-1 [Araneus ventricosus]
MKNSIGAPQLSFLPIGASIQLGSQISPNSSKNRRKVLGYLHQIQKNSLQKCDREIAGTWLCCLRSEPYISKGPETHPFNAASCLSSRELIEPHLQQPSRSFWA